MEKLNERAACFVAKFACELAESFMPQDGMCRQKKSNGSFQKQPLKSTFSSRGREQREGFILRRRKMQEISAF